MQHLNLRVGMLSLPKTQLQDVFYSLLCESLSSGCPKHAMYGVICMLYNILLNIDQGTRHTNTNWTGLLDWSFCPGVQL